MSKKTTINKATHPEAYTPSTKNMEAPETIAPVAAVCQLKKWKDGRKFGALPIFKANVARFVTRNVIRYCVQVKSVICPIVLAEVTYSHGHERGDLVNV